MTDLEAVIHAVRETMESAKLYAEGLPDTQGQTIHPSNLPALGLAMGMFQTFIDKLEAVQAEIVPR